MAAKIRIPPEAVSDLQSIRDMGPEILGRVAELLSHTPALPLRRSKLKELVGKVVIDPSQCEGLVRQLVAFNQLIRQREYESVEVLLNGIRHGLEYIDPRWTIEEMERWAVIETQLSLLVKSRPVRAVSKATDLEYEFANLFKSSRIVTDIRPVFNDGNGEELAIEGAIVSHTLRVLYDNSQGDHVLNIAMDRKDILALQSQCERALRKAQLAKQLVSATVPVAISGDEENA